MNILSDGKQALLIHDVFIYAIDVRARSVAKVFELPSGSASGVAIHCSSASSESEDEGSKRQKTASNPANASGLVGRNRVRWSGVAGLEGNTLVASDNRKCLHTIDTLTWTSAIAKPVCIEKTATSIRIIDSTLYVADKFGEVWTASLDNLFHADTDAFPGKPIIGHISMILDMIVLPSFILTCDRDEKIRVTLRERPWMIDQFLLEHRSYVSCIAACLDDQSGRCVVVSAGGDAEVMLWEWTPGDFRGLCEDSDAFKQQLDASRARLVDKLDLGSGGLVDVTGMATHDRNVYLMVEGQPRLVHLEIAKDNTLQRRDDIGLQATPACLAVADGRLLVGLENGQLLIDNEPISDFAAPHPVESRRCSQLRKTAFDHTPPASTPQDEQQ